MTGDHRIRGVGFANSQISLGLDSGSDGIAVVAGRGVSLVAINSTVVGLASGGRSIDCDHDGLLEASSCTQATDGTGDGAARLAQPAEAEAKVTPVGKVSVRVTPVALEGPALVMVRV